MGRDFLSQLPGRAANVGGLGLDLAMILEASQSPAALQALLTNQALARTDPALRGELERSPFLAGALGGLPVHSQPVPPSASEIAQLGQLPVPARIGAYGELAQAPGRPRRLAPYLPPLSTAQRAQTALESAEEREILRDPTAAARAKLRIPQPIPPGTNVRLTRIGPSGPVYEVVQPGGDLQPTNVGGLYRDPTSNRIIHAPAAATADPAARGYLTDARRFDPRRLEGIASGVLPAKDLTPAQARTMLAAQRAQAAQAAAERTQQVDAVKQLALTNATKTMLEAVPSVTHLADRIERDLQKVEVGPFAGRWQELWARRVGAADPAFIHLRTNMDLLSTLLARMHVGARGSEGMVARFQELLGTGQQSPENLRAALDAIREYAGDLQTMRQRTTAGAAGTPGQAPQPGAQVLPGVRYLGPEPGYPSAAFEEVVPQGGGALGIPGVGATLPGGGFSGPVNQYPSSLPPTIRPSPFATGAGVEQFRQQQIQRGLVPPGGFGYPSPAFLPEPAATQEFVRERFAGSHRPRTTPRKGLQRTVDVLPASVHERAAAALRDNPDWTAEDLLRWLAREANLSPEDVKQMRRPATH